MITMCGKLYVVGTPIGNLKDITQRAIDTFLNADFICAEDSRVTLKLLNYLNIKKTIISYYEYSKEEKSEIIIERILQGQSCALVSDAGMPCISDPGEYLVQKCAERNITVTVIPGPCAISSALSLAGTFGGKFVFYGFLSVNKKSRKTTLENLKNEDKALVFYEAPHKLYRTLCDLYTYLGDRKMVLVKELTKIHENAEHITLKEAVSEYKSTSIKGEYVLIVKPVEKKSKLNDETTSLKIALELYKDYLNKANSKNEALQSVCKKTGIRKNVLYKEILKFHE